MSITAFPMDSQVTEMGEDGLPVYDRAFSSADLREVYKTFFSNGYFAEDGTSMDVKAGPGLYVTVRAGKVNIQGVLGFMDEDASIRLDNADSANPRIDTIVARLDLSMTKRCIELVAKTGTPSTSPVAPALTRAGDVFELGLADVDIPAGSTEVLDSNIKDTRLDTTRCGVVEPFAKLDTASLFEQVTAIVAQAQADVKADTDALEKATGDAVSAMNDALSSTVLGSVWRLQSSSTADYLVYGDDLNNISGVGSKFCDSASVAGGIQHKPADVTGAFVLYTFATETDPSRLGQIILTCDAGGVQQWTRSGAGSSWTSWGSVGDVTSADLDELKLRVARSVSGVIKGTSAPLYTGIRGLQDYTYVKARFPEKDSGYYIEASGVIDRTSNEGYAEAIISGTNFRGGALITDYVPLRIYDGSGSVSEGAISYGAGRRIVLQPRSVATAPITGDWENAPYTPANVTNLTFIAKP